MCDKSIILQENDLEPKVLLNVIIKPTLTYIDLGGMDAETIVFNIAKQESSCGKYIRQLGYGDGSLEGAFGIYQCELKTYYDIYDSYLSYHHDLIEKVDSLKIKSLTDAENLMYNLPYATAICRVHLYRFKEKLPKYDDIEGQAKFWKKYYNTELGKGEEPDFIFNASRF